MNFLTPGEIQNLKDIRYNLFGIQVEIWPKAKNDEIGNKISNELNIARDAISAAIEYSRGRIPPG